MTVGVSKDRRGVRRRVRAGTRQHQRGVTIVAKEGKWNESEEVFPNKKKIKFFSKLVCP